MNIANLPVASPLQYASPEQKQRSAEFKLLDTALKAGNLPEALKAMEILQLKTPNPAQSAQKQRQFGHDNQAGKEFEVLANALKSGDLSGAQAALAPIKERNTRDSRAIQGRSQESGSEADQDQGGENPDSDSDESMRLDILA